MPKHKKHKRGARGAGPMRAAAPPAAPMPGAHEFSADQEQAMRQSARTAMPAAMPQGGEPDGDDDFAGGM